MQIRSASQLINIGSAQLSTRQKLRSQKGLSEISQFLPALYILFLLTLVPLLDLVNLLVAGAVQNLATNDIAAKVATQQNYDSSLNTLFNEAINFQSNGLAKFVNLTPNGGFVGCSNDLYVLSTDLNSGMVTSSEPDAALNQTIDTKANMYEISVKSNYSIPPLISLAALPLLGDVPGLSRPVSFTFSATRPVEQPAGLQISQNNSNWGSPVTPFARARTAPPQTPAPPTNITWSTPGLYNQIQQNGQTVVGVSVLIVQANYGTTVGAITGGWVDSGLSIQSGQKLYVDTQASGSWTFPWYQTGTTSIGGYLATNASGAPIGTNVSLPASWVGQFGVYSYPAYCSYPLSPGMLICFIGPSANGPPVYPYGFQVPPETYYSQANMFVPKNQYGFVGWPTGPYGQSASSAGEISFAANYNQASCSGYQIIRVVVAQ